MSKKNHLNVHALRFFNKTKYKILLSRVIEVAGGLLDRARVSKSISL